MEPSIKHYSPIAVSTVKEDSFNYPAGTDVKIIGWGLTSDQAATIPNELYYADSVLTSHDACADVYSDIVVGRDYCIDTTGGISTCSVSQIGILAQKRQTV